MLRPKLGVLHGGDSRGKNYRWNSALVGRIWFPKRVKRRCVSDYSYWKLSSSERVEYSSRTLSGFKRRSLANTSIRGRHRF